MRNWIWSTITFTAAALVFLVLYACLNGNLINCAAGAILIVALVAYFKLCIKMEVAQ